MQADDEAVFKNLCSIDVDMWTYFSLNLSREEQLHQWMQDAITSLQQNTRIPFTIIDMATQQIVGSSSIGNISHYDKRLEIGWSWLAPPFRGTFINKSAKYLLMQYAFEVMEFERVEFKTGVLNARARNGLKNIGAVEEGTLRSHSLLWNGHRRTSVFYSVLKEEWADVKKYLLAEINK